MKTQVEFRSSKFQLYPDEEDIVNPGRYGKRLAEYLHRRFPKYGIKVKEIYPEDWGWVVPIENKKFSVWVGCGNYQEYEDGFLCFIEPSKPVLRKFLKKIDTTDVVRKVKNALENILISDSEVRNIKWVETDNLQSH